jgi:hypothetical protein
MTEEVDRVPAMTSKALREEIVKAIAAETPIRTDEIDDADIDIALVGFRLMASMAARATVTSGPYPFEFCYVDVKSIQTLDAIAAEALGEKACVTRGCANWAPSGGLCHDHWNTEHPGKIRCSTMGCQREALAGTGTCGECRELNRIAAAGFDGQPYDINPNHPIAQVEANGGSVPNVPGAPPTRETLERAIIPNSNGCEHLVSEWKASADVVGLSVSPYRGRCDLCGAVLEITRAAMEAARSMSDLEGHATLVGDARPLAPHAGFSLRACDCQSNGIIVSASREYCNKHACTCRCHPENR